VTTSGYAAGASHGIATGDAVQVSLRGRAEPIAGVVADDGTVATPPKGAVFVRGVADDAALTKGKNGADGSVRLLARHTPRVCVAGVVRQSVCVDAVLALDAAVAASDPLPSARVDDVFGWRDRDGALVRVSHDELLAGLHDRDIVVVP